MKRLAVLLAVLLVCQSASARIGETLEQCIARYGKPVHVHPVEDLVQFEKNEIKITVVFLRATCQAIMFESAISDELTDAQLKILLTANLGDSYTELDNEESGRRWRGATTDSVGTYRKGVLAIASKKYYLHLDEIERKKEQLDRETF